MSTCTTCSNPTATLRCSRCKFAHYCNKKCQRKDWKFHKFICKSHSKKLQHQLADADNEQKGDNNSVIKFSWKIDKNVLNDIRNKKKYQSDEIQVADNDEYTWKLSLEPNNNIVFLRLSLSGLPKKIGAIKVNCKMVCEELLYEQNYEGVVLTMDTRKNLRPSLQRIAQTTIMDYLDWRKIDKEEINSLLFECSVEILMRHDLFGGECGVVSVIRFTWKTDKSVLDDMRNNKQCQSNEFQVADNDKYKWILSLKPNNNSVCLILSLSGLPKDVGAIRVTCKIVCDELLYSQRYGGILLTMPIRKRYHSFDNAETTIMETFDWSKFEIEEINCLVFKCSVYILMRYDLFGGIFSVQNKSYASMEGLIAPSGLNHTLVFGYINEIHDFNLNEIEVLPLSIYELIYKYYLGMFRVMM